MANSTAFYTDHYELTMIDAALQSGTAHRPSVFELFTRRLPGARRYGVLAGTGRLLQAISDFRFTDAQLTWLSDQSFLRGETLDWLANYRFSGNIYGYPEGELFFPGSPLLTVESSFAEGVLLETLALSILNADSAVATAASRMYTAAKGRPLAEMGSRRTAETSAVNAARAAYLAGFNATSNLEAGRAYGVPTMGTAAHAFTLLHDSEADAFAAQVASFGANTTLLIDTYDIQQGVRNAIAAAGPELGAVRIDSGDLPVVVQEVRELLDSLGAKNTKITVTNDLDEYTIAALCASPVDNFGVGTSVATGSGSPTMSMVYKLVARQDSNGNWVNVAKRSAAKASVGGKKTAFRSFDRNGVADTEILIADTPHAAPLQQFDVVEGTAERITVPLVINGDPLPEHLGAAGLQAARARHKTRVAQLPPLGHSLQRGEPVLATVLR
ncbi:nicotinate phosphoribosyltransferase [Leucobacter sp. OH2974_COT-288]|nr:nicotinate phosphoribosyltransferase [Leucobacter sp. OH2974_COT-288]